MSRNLARKRINLIYLTPIIRANQRKLESIEERHKELQAEIEGYRSVGNGFLDAARDKTDGLTTEEEINTAIESLGATIQEKAGRREEADQKLQEGRDQRTEKQANHRNCQNRQAECGKNFETASDAYFDKLSSVGFDSLEAHDSAFRADSEMQRIQKEIDDFTQEKHRLEEEITKLQTQFEETPFDLQVLGRITAQVEEIKAQVQEVQRDIVVKQIEIAQLTDALSKREALDDEIQTAD